jgi:hypothetical protein
MRTQSPTFRTRLTKGALLWGSALMLVRLVTAGGKGAHDNEAEMEECSSFVAVLLAATQPVPGFRACLDFREERLA